MTGRRHRRARGALLRPACAAAIVLSVVAGVPAGAAPTAPREAGVDPAVTVVLDAVTPVSVTDGQTLTLRGTVHVGAADATGLHVEVGVGEPVSSRSALDRRFDAGGSAPSAVDVTTPLADCTTCLAGRAEAVPAGRTVGFAVAVPLGRRLDRAVVSAYPLVVRVAGTAGDQVATVLGEADSWLPYFPGSVASPLRVSWVWPLDPAPVLAADGSVADAAFPASLGSAGALGRQLAATTAPPGTTGAGGQPGFAPVTYAVDPALLEAATATARDGWRRTGSRTTERASAEAADFLTTLRTATRGRGVVALPYADPDAAALVHAGLALDLTGAVSTGAAELSQSLPDADVLGGVGWVPGDAVDQAELDAYAAAGTTTLVLPGGQLAVPDDASTPTATSVTALPTRGPTVRGLVTDPDAEALVAAGGRDQPSAAMSTQRLLALLAVIVAEAPNSEATRDLVLTVPRGADPSAGWARAELTATGSVPWLRAVALDDTAGDPSAPRQSLAAYPAPARAAELPADALTGPQTGVAAVRQAVAEASSMFDATAAAETARPLDLALGRAESYAWRTDLSGAAALRAGTAGLTAALTRRVGLASAPTVTLASDRASIPVTVENGLGDAVTVTLALASTDRTKIEPITRTVTVPAGRKLRVLLPAQVDRAGTFRASVTMRTPGGSQIAAAPIAIHSRAYGALTLAITFGALAVLVLALVVRGVRRIRHRGRAGAPA